MMVVLHDIHVIQFNFHQLNAAVLMCWPFLFYCNANFASVLLRLRIDQNVLQQSFIIQPLKIPFILFHFSSFSCLRCDAMNA